MSIPSIQIFLEPPLDFTPEVEVSSCLLEVGHEFLMVKRAKGKLEELTWCVPGGKLDQGETKEEAVMREIREETSILLDPALLKARGSLYIRKPHVELILHVYTQTFSTRPEVLLNEEHIEYIWTSLPAVFMLPLTSGAKEILLHIYPDSFK